MGYLSKHSGVYNFDSLFNVTDDSRGNSNQTSVVAWKQEDAPTKTDGYK